MGQLLNDAIVDSGGVLLGIRAGREDDQAGHADQLGCCYHPLEHRSLLNSGRFKGVGEVRSNSNQ